MKTTSWLLTAAIIAVIALTLFARNDNGDEVLPDSDGNSLGQAVAVSPSESTKTTTLQFTLKTVAEHGKLLYQGVGGEIDSMINPDLHVPAGAVVEITLINADGMPHNIFLPDFNAQSSYVVKIGDQTEIVFASGTFPSGSYLYYCEVPGHRQAGQEGRVVVTKP